MLTEDEAGRLYRDILEWVGDDLARDIEISVVRAAVRGGGDVTRRDPSDQGEFNNLDAVAVALRILLSALDPIFQLAETRRVLHAPSEGEVAEERKIIWELDRAALTRVEDVLEHDPTGLVNVEPVPRLSADDLLEARKRVEKLLRLVREFEDKLERGAEQ